ncbi:hypothetical protein N7462_001678 [Penicillium macrosclerotiorum]|uniref:uncharacterized protein n=1 Tax=Penicillium macrosclerotiorum TaxID=303699 RepID=UPI002547C21A|nr:uncharacterized protein N7462_001678 [Penicillium macrosclerotiorum]KAJ5692255.1 hypothetical protein N7462_001678 [Penicillium macrosclerotiorum]
MADSNSWQGRTAQNHSSQPNAGSPLTPGSASGNPISFRTNVNRAKTKRWVEAKQYSYDGGDWGDEDDEEEEPPAVSQPLNPTGSSSTDNKLNASGGDQKALPFVRPADIYKRMREDNTNNNPSPRGTSDSLPTPVQSGGPPTQPSPASNDDSSRPTQTIPSIGLPELKRMSGFGADFLGGGDSSFQQNTRPKSQEPPLQHNPSQASQASQGFTSVVHQAFDVPETPESVSGSVARSNSDGTSVISPIISTRSQPDKTPTIPEEPTESSTPTAASQNAAGDVPFFKPGHRRDMSLPSRDNSPSKQPVITDNDTPSAGQAEMTSESPGDFTSPGMSLDALASPPNTSTTLPSSTGQEDFVAPLKLGSQGTSASEAYRGEIPTIIPDVAGNSPHDTDNDRLREEIMRSLSRENSQEPESINQQPPTANQSQSIPHQYEKFWDGQTGPNPDDAPKPLVSEAHPDWNAAHPLANQDPYATNQTPVANASPPAAGLPTKPRLARRFSWESASSAEEPVPQAPAAPALDAGLANQEPEPIPDDSTLMAEKMWREQPLTDSELSDARVEKPRLSIVPPIPTSSSPPEQIMGPTDGPLSREEKYVSADVGTSIDEKKLQGFRDILNKPSPADRIHAFDQTRDQFAVLDTGLTQWLQLTIQEHPEHAGLIQSSQTLSSGFPKTSPITRKFPKLTSLGNLASSKDDGTPAGAGHARRPSGHIGTIVNRQNVEQRGKDFFHTAGAFSGKAGEAAKGLFAKGRSRFRAGGDKVDT